MIYLCRDNKWLLSELPASKQLNMIRHYLLLRMKYILLATFTSLVVYNVVTLVHIGASMKLIQSRLRPLTTTLQLETRHIRKNDGHEDINKKIIWNTDEKDQGLITYVNEVLPINKVVNLTDIKQNGKKRIEENSIQNKRKTGPENNRELPHTISRKRIDNNNNNNNNNNDMEMINLVGITGEYDGKVDIIQQNKREWITNTRRNYEEDVTIKKDHFRTAASSTMSKSYNIVAGSDGKHSNMGKSPVPPNPIGVQRSSIFLQGAIADLWIDTCMNITTWHNRWFPLFPNIPQDTKVVEQLNDKHTFMGSLLRRVYGYIVISDGDNSGMVDFRLKTHEGAEVVIVDTGMTVQNFKGNLMYNQPFT